MSKNLSYYASLSGKTQKELAEIVGVAPSTFNDWMKGKKYPRIDKIELLANYFGILKSDLIEERTEKKNEMHEKNDTMASIVIRMRTDEDFCSLVEKLYELDNSQIESVKNLLTALVK